MNAIPNLLRENADWLADACQSRQHDQTVTLEEALTYVDHDHVAAWVEQEIKGRSPQSMLSDAFEGLTDAEAKSVLLCLLNETDTARKILAEQLRAYVANDLVYAAEQLIENFDPSDAQIDAGTLSDAIYNRRQQERADAYFDGGAL